ncbi:TPA: ImpA family type VI secretion system protein, partial [Serratia odorifera]
NASGLQSFADEQLGNQQLNAAFLDSDPEQLQATRDALSAARTACEAIEQQVNDQVGSAQGVDLSALKQPLKQALQLLNQAVPGTDSSSDPEAVSEDNAPSVDAAAPAAPRPTGDIATRDDVLRSLDKILAYYTRHEPSSPLPVLLNRAKNLVHADFAAIVRNLIPDGMSQFENLRGPDSE